jgi:hypothetical protein
MTDERRDDEILGRALARAIETIDLNETPYERSRIATQPVRRGFPLWQIGAAAAAIVLALALGAWFTRPLEGGPVAGSPSPTIPPTTQPGATQSPAPSGAFVATRVFFVRDLLPPLSASLPSGGAHIAVDSIVERVAVTHAAPGSAVPSGAVNPLAVVPLRADGTSVSAAINGDTADVQFDLPTGWGVHGAAQVQALVQQLVYVITEEPGIRKARITEKGKASAVIDGLVVDRPLSREDVTDYSEPGSTKAVQGFGDASPNTARTLTTATSVESVAPGLARFVVTTDLQNVAPGQIYPDFKVEVFANDETAKPLGGKWRMVITVNGTDTGGARADTTDKSPLRSVVVMAPKCLGCTGTIYELGLDDLRPWRTAVLTNPVRIVVDIGGDPRMITGSNAVYTPLYGATVAHTFTVSGIEHNFEANVLIRVKDARGNEIYRSSTTGTNCCDPGGTFQASVTLPASVSGNVTLEVLEASPKDGSDTKVIAVPLVVR